jgi:hypothetical protein
MGKVIYSMSVSLDGFVETPNRSLDSGVVLLRYETVGSSA